MKNWFKDGCLWYCDNEGLWYKYPFDYTVETEEEIEHNIELLLKGEFPKVDIDIDVDCLD